MKRQWQFTLTRRVLDEPTRTTQHTYTVDSPQALELLVQRASKDRDVVAYMFERVVDEVYRAPAKVTPPNRGPNTVRSMPG